MKNLVLNLISYLGNILIYHIRYFILTPFFDEDNFNSLITVLYILLSLILLTFMIIFTIAYS